VSHRLRAVLFDLGNTLMYALDPWEPVFTRATESLTTSLLSSGLPLDTATFPAVFDARLGQYYDQRDHSLTETSTMVVLADLLKTLGHPAATEVVRRALDAFYAVTQTNWILEADAIPVLQELQALGYRLAILSNASDNQDVFQLVERFGIEPYFDFVLTSAVAAFRKPHPQIFELALAHWGFPAEDVAMVGDTLRADIRGANASGLYSIWIDRRANRAAAPTSTSRPQAVISSLADLPRVLARA